MTLVVVPTLVVSATLFSSMASGALPASFALSANAFTVAAQESQVAADRLVGRDFVQYGALDHGKEAVYPVILSGIRSADIDHLCQSVVSNVPGLGRVTLKITAGDAGRPVHADRLITDAEDIRGDALFTDIAIGKDASTLDFVPGLPGAFSQQARTVRIDRLRQHVRSTSAATFRLPHLHISVSRQQHPCF